MFELFKIMNCFFHMCQSVHKRISKSLRNLSDKAFARVLRFMASLALISLRSIEDVVVDPQCRHIYPELLAVVN